jgi:hypothetical protein
MFVVIRKYCINKRIFLNNQIGSDIIFKYVVYCVYTFCTFFDYTNSLIDKNKYPKGGYHEHD